MRISRTARAIAAMGAAASACTALAAAPAWAAPADTTLPSRLTARGTCTDATSTAQLLPARFWSGVYGRATVAGTISRLEPDHPYVVVAPARTPTGDAPRGVTDGSGTLRITIPD